MTVEERSGGPLFSVVEASDVKRVRRDGSAQGGQPAGQFRFQAVPFVNEGPEHVGFIARDKGRIGEAPVQALGRAGEDRAIVGGLSQTLMTQSMGLPR